MFFLYLLECMSRVLLSVGGSPERPMRTTGNDYTNKDAIIGIVCWTVLVLIVVSVVLLIRHRLKK